MAALRIEAHRGMGGWAVVVRAMRASRRVGHVIVVSADRLRFMDSSVRAGACSLALLAAEREVERRLPVFLVDRAELDEAERGSGTGVEMYARAVVEVAAMGGVLVPTRCWMGSGTSGDALRVWRSAGLARRVAVFNGLVAYGGPEIPPGRREV